MFISPLCESRGIMVYKQPISDLTFEMAFAPQERFRRSPYEKKGILRESYAALMKETVCGAGGWRLSRPLVGRGKKSIKGIG